jgi:tRNA (guanine-N7-)-methyltransferase
MDSKSCREKFTPDSPFNTPRQVVIEPPGTPLAGPVDWSTLYGRSAPLAVEIGGGGGRTIINMALARLDWNFLEIERTGEYYRMALKRVVRRKISNLRVVRTDAAYLLHSFFPDACVNEYHIYFPDPWPKKRHHKRRIFTEAFCAGLRRTLVPGGVLFAATDFREYYEELLPRLRAVLTVQEHPGVWEDAPQGRTNFEVKYLRAGREIYRLVARK